MQSTQNIAIVTGASGMDGSHLIDHLIDRECWRIFALVRRHGSGGFPERLKHLVDAENLHFVWGDVTDGPCIDELVATARNIAMQENVPSSRIAVFNLAANSFVGSSWSCPQEHLNTNTLGLLNIVRAVKQYTPHSFVYQASTSEMFGDSPAPQNEDTPLRPLSPYAISKTAAHHIAHCYRKLGMNIWCGILFNHESPRRGMEFVTQRIAFHMARIARRIGPPYFYLGDISSKRDWGCANLYTRLMVDFFNEHVRGAPPRDVVVGTGETHTVEEFAKACFEVTVTSLNSNYDGIIRKREARMRPDDVRVLCADNRKLKSIVGEVPMPDLPTLVQEMTRRWMSATQQEIMDKLIECPVE